ncbi:hypothetical protein CANTEDRAFT_113770 [Yamadazyma tenuis ATCC 10573]|uniref:C3H1-type domain-containing protein n=1 Tax=Candida tenuis (strain ATCC 10573 / BCRC 21748 / CBS 615 / JCM 9827 / NBRC 10315 / NRRL Y-1498 / VKM Y-70) TaxID=590646 RepID=G3B3U2_CANTC|nr:uncharacterized protein CANTEDRAFT_113770 [Yamadazyma tenuis ATCC 10573]EGV63733.1 hypothetical protein CANTEDRAFT_113770 [Yamadazyma tenuis ATCC 10573]
MTSIDLLSDLWSTDDTRHLHSHQSPAVRHNIWAGSQYSQNQVSINQATPSQISPPGVSSAVALVASTTSLAALSKVNSNTSTGSSSSCSLLNSGIDYDLNYIYGPSGASTTSAPPFADPCDPFASSGQSLTAANLASINSASPFKSGVSLSPISSTPGSVEDKKPVNTQLYKTELCGSFMKNSYCPYGNKCQFAHGECELKRVERPSNWRSKPCANWSRFGSCRYGNRCCFKHGH